jgi:PPOX class probable F420-dependent enzyme
MSLRDAVRMTAAETAAFLAEPRTLNVATVGPDGDIHLVAMWFTMHADCPVFTTYGNSQKVVNLRRDPRLTALVEGGDTYDSLRGVELVGTAQIIDDPAEVLALVVEIGVKYAGRSVQRDPQRAAAKRVGVRLVPRRVVTWDHAKLGAVSSAVS